MTKALEALKRGLGARRHDRAMVLPQLLGNKALALEKLGDPETALGSLEDSFRSNPSYFRATRDYRELIGRLAGRLAGDPGASERIRQLAGNVGVELAAPPSGSGR